MKDLEPKRLTGSKILASVAVGVVLLLSVTACEEEVVRPPDATASDEHKPCIICDDSSGFNPDTVGSGWGTLHNAGMDSVLVLMEDMAGDSLLDAPEAEDLGQPRIEDYVEAQETTYPPGTWEDAHEVRDHYLNGEDIVSIYSTGEVSSAAEDFARELLAIYPPDDPQPLEEIEASLDTLKVNAKSVLSGDEYEGFARIVEISRGSTQHWTEAGMLSSWDATLTYDLTVSGSQEMCGWVVLAADVAGAIWGFVTGGPLFAALVAAIQSANAIIFGCLL